MFPKIGTAYVPKIEEDTLHTSLDASPLINSLNHPMEMAQDTRQTTVYAKISGDEVEKLLEKMSLIFQRKTDSQGDPLFRVALGRYKVTMLFYGCSNNTCEDISLATCFGRSNQPTAATINQWNSNHRFSRAYLDDEGDPCIESDLFLNGGVSLEHIRNFITYFRGFVEDFEQFLNAAEKSK